MEQIFVILAVVILVISTFFFQSTRSNDILSQWAAENGYRVLSREYRSFLRGPFFLTTTKDQTVYYVTVEDAQGNVRHGWVRCGSLWLGLLSSQVQVEWED